MMEYYTAMKMFETHNKGGESQRYNIKQNNP